MITLKFSYKKRTSGLPEAPFFEIFFYSTLLLDFLPGPYVIRFISAQASALLPAFPHALYSSIKYSRVCASRYMDTAKLKISENILLNVLDVISYISENIS